MEHFQEVLEKYEELWRRAEQCVTDYFEAMKPQESDLPPSVDVKELNTVVTLLKRMQDARKALHIEAVKLEGGKENAQTYPELDHSEISRILHVLEQNGVAVDAEEADD